LFFFLKEKEPKRTFFSLQLCSKRRIFARQGKNPFMAKYLLLNEPKRTFFLPQLHGKRRILSAKEKIRLWRSICFGVKILIHRLGGILGDYFRQLFQRRGFHCLYRFKVLQQLTATFLPHSGYFVQNGGFYMGRLQLAVVFNGKSVRLLLNLPDEGEHCRNGLNANLPAIRVD
jgi:hypothetical protein